MSTRISAMSAIGLEYLCRIVRPYLFRILFIFIVLFALDVFLAYFLSNWWLLFAVPLALFGVVFAAAWMALEAALQRMRPHLSDQQRSAVRQFVDKIEKATGDVHTPKYVLLYRLVRDVLNHKTRGYLYEMAHNTTSLKTDFEKLNDLF